MDCRYVAVPASRRTSRAGARQQLLLLFIDFPTLGQKVATK